ncbi:MAG: TonB-dependent receptor [Novosphingobium sp.]|nr:TonB-dependent receptor [Novosphingobium sp.]
MSIQRKFRTGLLAGTALAVTGMAFAPAIAQAAEDDGDRNVIVVTAQKREQNLKDVPVAVTAISGDALVANRVTNVTDLSSLAPGVTVRTSAGGSQLPSFTIRGAVSYGVVPGSDKQVSIYLDGVYISAPRGSIFDLPDVQRIELLRGPQGTLFGRNATAGAVSISTRDPSGEIGAKFTGTVGNRNHYRIGASLDLPKFGPFSGYISYVKNHKRGDIRNVGAGMQWDRTASQTAFNRGVATSPEFLGNKDSDSFFAALKFETGDFKTVYKFDRNDYDGSPEGTGYVAHNTAVPGIGAFITALINSQPGVIPTAPNGKRPKAVANSYVVPNKSYVEGHSVTSTYEVSDSVTIKNVAAYRTSQLWATSSLGGLSALTLTAQAAPFLGFPAFLVGTPFTVVSTQSQSRSKQWSDEFQVNYDSDFLTATAGLLWFHSKDWAGEPKLQGTSFFGLHFGGVLQNTSYSTNFNKASSVAAYTQLEFHLTPQLDVILGGRITSTKKSGNVVAGVNLTMEEIIPFTYKDTRPSYLIGVNYKPNDDILVYAKFSTAFVAGGSVGGVPFEPELAQSWEAGVKTELFDRKLRFNLALYYARYKNFQTAQSASFVPSLVLALTGDPTLASKLGTIVVSQGGLVTAKGFEFDFTIAPTTGVTIGGSLSYDDTTFKNVSPLLLAATGGEWVPTYRPNWTGGLYGQYDTQPLFGDAYMTFRLDGNYQSKMLTASNQSRGAYAPAILAEGGYWLLNGRVALRDFEIGGAKAELGLWGKNLTDEGAKTFALEISGIISGANYIPARSYGLDLTIEFR